MLPSGDQVTQLKKAWSAAGLATLEQIIPAMHQELRGMARK